MFADGAIKRVKALHALTSPGHCGQVSLRGHQRVLDCLNVNLILHNKIVIWLREWLLNHGIFHFSLNFVESWEKLADHFILWCRVTPTIFETPDQYIPGNPLNWWWYPVSNPLRCHRYNPKKSYCGAESRRPHLKHQTRIYRETHSVADGTNWRKDERKRIFNFEIWNGECFATYLVASITAPTYNSWGKW